jgi:hypothetical protein
MSETNIPKPESLEAKFRLMTVLPYDKRAKRKHILVYGFILDWFHSKYGDALASVRHIVANLKDRDPFEAGLYTGDVHSALTDLVAWGYLAQEKGSGRRASRYVPVWEKPVVFIKLRTLPMNILAFGKTRTHAFGKTRTLQSIVFGKLRTKTHLLDPVYRPGNM